MQTISTRNPYQGPPFTPCLRVAEYVFFLSSPRNPKDHYFVRAKSTVNIHVSPSNIQRKQIFYRTIEYRVPDSHVDLQSWRTRRRTKLFLLQRNYVQCHVQYLSPFFSFFFSSSQRWSHIAALERILLLIQVVHPSPRCPIPVRWEDHKTELKDP